MSLSYQRLSQISKYFDHSAFRKQLQDKKKSDSAGFYLFLSVTLFAFSVISLFGVSAIITFTSSNSNTTFLTFIGIALCFVFIALGVSNISTFKKLNFTATVPSVDELKIFDSLVEKLSLKIKECVSSVFEITQVLSGNPAIGKATKIYIWQAFSESDYIFLTTNDNSESNFTRTMFLDKKLLKAKQIKSLYVFDENNKSILIKNPIKLSYPNKLFNGIKYILPKEGFDINILSPQQH